MGHLHIFLSICPSAHGEIEVLKIPPVASLADVTEAYHQQALRCGSITTAGQHKCWELMAALQVAP